MDNAESVPSPAPVTGETGVAGRGGDSNNPAVVANSGMGGKGGDTQARGMSFFHVSNTTVNLEGMSLVSNAGDGGAELAGMVAGAAGLPTVGQNGGTGGSALGIAVSAMGKNIQMNIASNMTVAVIAGAGNNGGKGGNGGVGSAVFRAPTVVMV